MKTVKIKDKEFELFLTQEVIEKAIDEDFDILILDELIDAIDLKIIELSDVTDFLKTKPKSLEVIITGHTENIKLIELADYVTEFVSIKHPYLKILFSK